MRFLKSHPLLAIILLALILRITAVIFSQGYMASDDHHETIKIAWQWLTSGQMFNQHGQLTWGSIAGDDIMRSPLYNLFVYLLMQIGSLLGLPYLDQTMYLQRAVHALLSLILIVYTHRYLKEEADETTANWGALIVSVHFLMPFLSVRNLIEMISAELLLPALYYAHIGLKRNDQRYLALSAILGSLAWMIRPHTILALLPILPLIWLGSKKIKPILAFVLPFLGVILLSGLLDLFTVGRFLGTSIKYFTANLSSRPWLPGPIYQYLLLLTGIFIPPFSLLFLGSIFRRRLVSNNKILFWGTTLFFILHSLYRSKEERFMIPIFPLLVILGMLGLYYLFQSKGWYFKRSGLRKSLWIYAAVINLALLIPFMLNYSHKGRIEPLVFLSRQPDVRGVLFDCTERNVLIPLEYLGQVQPPSEKLVRFSQLDSLRIAPNYAVIFTDKYLQNHLDSLRQRFGRIKIVRHSSPSTVDYVLHILNPKYNHTNEAWVVKFED